MKEIRMAKPDLPVALITAYMSHDEALSKEEVKSADGFLQKPFPIQNIIRLLEDLTVAPPRKP